MYEDRTFENILAEMLDLVPADLDRREGSIICDALAPPARKLAEAYTAMSTANLQEHAQTASGDALRARGADFGVDPKPATPAVREGFFFDSTGAPFDVPIGSRFGAAGLIYDVTEKINAGNYSLTCETAGAAGNVPVGSLQPIDYVNGLATATLGAVLTPGTDDETDDAYRARLYAHIRTPPTSGNRSAYLTWALEVAGVGDAYVVPAWNGPNTVKVSLLGTDKLPASSFVVAAVKAYIDPDIGFGEGMGEGAAPAGAVVTVVAAPAVAVNVAAEIVLTGSRTLSQVRADFEAALVTYFAGIAYKKDPSVKLARIGAVLLDVPGVEDYSDLVLNGTAGNVSVPAGSVAVAGTVTVSE